jgi:uncharacterized protein YcgI (DUF1989 family)
MKINKFSKKPLDALDRANKNLVISYPVEKKKNNNLKILLEERKKIDLINEIIIPPRDAKCFTVKAGQFFRIECFEGSQVGDLNLFNADNLNEKFYSGKTRALYGTHLSVGDKMYSNFPYLRSMATITWDSLDWYGYDNDGASVHDVIGTRCDPYTLKLLSGDDYHYCCHSNLLRALIKEKGIDMNKAENLIHDVLNVFMCTGFTNDTKQYFMKASPSRKGDYLEFYAETNILGILSACPGGDCSESHSSDQAKCFPLKVSIWQNKSENKKQFTSNISNYNKNHGLD